MNLSPIHKDAIEDYFESGLSYANLAQKYGRDVSTLRKVIAAYRASHQETHGRDRERKVVPTNSKPTITGKPLSLSHSAIGVRLGRYMQRNGLQATAMGMLLEPMKSPNSINLAVIGAYDWTLCDLQSLAVFLGVPFDRLMLMEPEHAYA